MPDCIYYVIIAYDLLHKAAATIKRLSKQYSYLFCWRKMWWTVNDAMC